jgi:hypothetical protein
MSSGIPTTRINRLVLGYLWDISGIGQGYDQVLDIPGISFEAFGIFLEYPQKRQDIPKSENLEWDIPKLMNDKCKVFFFVLGYLSLSQPILVPILFRAMGCWPAWMLAYTYSIIFCHSIEPF